MSQLRYYLLQVLGGIRSSWSIQLASIGSITVGLLLVGLATLGALNVDRLTHSWNQGIVLTVYLKPDTPPSRLRKLEQLLNKQQVVASVRHISSKEAYQRLKKNLGNRHGLLAGVEPDFLPASLEVSLNETRPERLRPLLALLSISPVVEEVDYMGSWIKRLTSLVTLVRTACLVIALIVCLACLYIVGSTIRLGVLARKDEIQILKLVGATDSFVRAPFLIEGALQGLIGAIVACFLLFFIYHLSAPWVEHTMTSALSHTRLDFFSTAQLLLAAIGGALLGLAGSRLAFGRYLDV
jgi:cell division transport system permease protein